MKPMLCPVCNGTGKYHDASIHHTWDCHGCGGKGWVEVHEETPTTYPYPCGTTTTYPDEEY